MKYEFDDVPKTDETPQSLAMRKALAPLFDKLVDSFVNSPKMNGDFVVNFPEKIEVDNISTQQVEVLNPVTKVEITNLPIQKEMQKVEVVNQSQFPDIQKVEITNPVDKVEFPKVQKVEVTNQNKLTFPAVQQVEFKKVPENLLKLIPTGNQQAPHIDNANPTKYVVVRLTNGKEFIEPAQGVSGGGGGGGETIWLREEYTWTLIGGSYYATSIARYDHYRKVTEDIAYDANGNPIVKTRKVEKL
jgi:hypothetical protein